MGLIDKLKNVFFEEVEEEEVVETPKSYAKKVEIPKNKSFFFKNDDKEDEEENETDEVTKKDLDNFLEDDKEEHEEEKVIEPPKSIPMMFDEADFYDEESVSFEKKEIPDTTSIFKRENREYNLDKELYPDKKNDNYSNIKDKSAYSYTKTTYYEEKETKGFKPSPIISPIYGILDKNYRKEEVVTKRETRISGTYTKPDLDSVRNKAFSQNEVKEVKTKQTRKTSYSTDKRVYDVNNTKPEVSKVTLADADEYYNDLGLAYNVDYSDASRNESRSSKYNVKEKKKEKKEVDDNLFDLIDSMYNKED